MYVFVKDSKYLWTLNKNLRIPKMHKVVCTNSRILKSTFSIVILYFFENIFPGNNTYKHYIRKIQKNVLLCYLNSQNRLLFAHSWIFVKINDAECLPLKLGSLCYVKVAYAKQKTREIVWPYCLLSHLLFLTAAGCDPPC